MCKNVFEKKHGKTSGPETLIFNRFAKAWPTIKQNQFNHCLDDAKIRSKISDEDGNQIKQFCQNQLQTTQIRGDYKELLELVFIFLGGEAAHFHPCSATSHARFMSKKIYCLKIYLFRSQFKLTAKELDCIRDFSIFVVKLYVRAWFGCTNAIQCPNQDLSLLRDAFQYAKIDKVVSNAVIEKIKNHLWYLTPETVGLAFFDPNVPLEIKRKMVSRLKAKNPSVAFVEYRKHSNPENLLECDLSDFVSYKTKIFFSIFELQTDFFELDPSVWENEEEYQTASDFCQNLLVVNDTAERGVKFMKDYNRILTHDEDEMQFILQVVDSYRKNIPLIQNQH